MLSHTCDCTRKSTLPMPTGAAPHDQSHSGPSRLVSLSAEESCVTWKPHKHLARVEVNATWAGEKRKKLFWVVSEIVRMMVVYVFSICVIERESRLKHLLNCHCGIRWVFVLWYMPAYCCSCVILDFALSCPKYFTPVVANTIPGYSRRVVLVASIGASILVLLEFHA